MKIASLGFKFLAALLLCAFALNDQVLSQKLDMVSNFEQYKEIPKQNITVPKVVELDIDDYVDGGIKTRYALYDKKNNNWVKVAPVEKKIINEIRVSYDGGSFVSSKNKFPVVIAQRSENLERDEFVIQYDRNVDADGISFELSEKAYLPESVSIIADDEIILNNHSVVGNYLSFPSVNAMKFKVVFTHKDKISLNDFRINIKNDNYYIDSKIRFLAYPDSEYVLFINSRKYLENINVNNVSIELDDKNPIILNINSKNNPEYKFVPEIKDYDKDGVLDGLDNCPYLNNPKQEDLNNNLIGDECDDFDYDRIQNSYDNCPLIQNSDQLDKDLDGLGDACDDIESRWTENNKYLLLAAFAAFFLVILTLFHNVYKSKI